jgi:DNA-binding XRE family transcriptional regulator
MAYPKPTRVTNPEWLLLLRKRSNLTQASAAKKHGQTLFAYRKREELNNTLKKRWRVTLEEHEALWLRRVQSALSMQDLAHKIGISRFWLRQMEAGTAPLDRLREYWRTR